MSHTVFIGTRDAIWLILEYVIFIKNYIMNKKIDQIKPHMREIKVTRNPDGSKTTEVNPDDIREIGRAIVNILRLFIKK